MAPAVTEVSEMMLYSDLDVRGEEILFSCCPFSDMAPSQCSRHHPLTRACLGARRSSVMRFLGPWPRGGHTMSPLLPLVLSLAWRAWVIASFAFVGSVCAPCPALDPPLMCAMAGYVVWLPQAVRRNDW